MAPKDTTLPNPLDPFGEAEQQQLPVTRDTTERLFGMGVREGGALDRALQRHMLERQAQANMYRKNAADAYGLMHALQDPEFRKGHLNPKTGQPYSEADISELNNQA